MRTPGKRRFGKVGLADARGKPVLGMDAKGPTATPDEVEAYFRTLGARDWGASLDAAAPQRKRTGKKLPGPRPTAANDGPAPPAPRPKPPPPQVREAKPGDSPRLLELIQFLGHPIEEKQLRKNMASLRKAGDTTLVATLGKQIVGMRGVSRRVMIHRPAPLGRITALVVAEEAQGKGIGRLLVEAAELWLRKQSCQLIEVTSNDRRAEAHAFYRHMGYERSSIRFYKKL